MGKVISSTFNDQWTTIGTIDNFMLNIFGEKYTSLLIKK